MYRVRVHLGLVSTCSATLASVAAPPHGARQDFGGPNYLRRATGGSGMGCDRALLGGCSCDTPATQSKLRSEPRRGCSYTLERDRIILLVFSCSAAVAGKGEEEPDGMGRIGDGGGGGREWPPQWGVVWCTGGEDVWDGGSVAKWVRKCRGLNLHPATCMQDGIAICSGSTNGC